MVAGSDASGNLYITDVGMAWWTSDIMEGGVWLLSYSSHAGEKIGEER
jgi:hypothetical protein